ncbi:MAG: type II toxin-antitoxin system RelE/ParE family toxin [Elusimicrobia bacterium]|nr:type II toxin-antitoxin system RelE/ParE family toxin [Elusimicrobiota bacterium]
MPAYEVGFPSAAIEKSFERELSRLDRGLLLRIKEAVDSLGENPRPQGKKVKALRPPLRVSLFLAQYRIRVGDYRILYDIDDSARKVILLALRRRSEKTYR